MAIVNAQKIEYDFDYGWKHDYEVFPANDIGLCAKHQPGFYAWYLQLPHINIDENILKAYADVFACKQFDITAEAHLGEKYSGSVLRDGMEIRSPSVLASVFSTVSAVFSPPIYIGISVDIKKRLLRHRKAILDNLNVTAPSPAGSPVVSMDTNAESKNFGERIAGLLRSHSLLDLNHLYVKVIYQPQLGPNHLKEVEFFANRTFCPICGRK